MGIMPGNPRAIVAEAEQRFPVRIVIRVPGDGIGTRYGPMTEWLDENCGIRGVDYAGRYTRRAERCHCGLHEWPDLCGRLRRSLVHSWRSAGLLRIAAR